MFHSSCNTLSKELSNLEEVIDSHLNSYFVDISNRMFQKDGKNISLYDLPIILEPVDKFKRDFNHTAFIHIGQAPTKVREKAIFLSKQFSFSAEESYCLHLPINPKAMSVTAAYNEDHGKTGQTREKFF